MPIAEAAYETVTWYMTSATQLPTLQYEQSRGHIGLDLSREQSGSIRVPTSLLSDFTRDEPIMATARLPVIEHVRKYGGLRSVVLPKKGSIIS